MNRWIRIGVMVMFALAALLPMSALAGVDYCEADPIVMIGNQQASIKVGVPVDQIPLITGTVVTTLEVPQGAPTKVMFVSQKFFPQAVEIVQSPTLVWNPDTDNLVLVRTVIPGLPLAGSAALRVKSLGQETFTTSTERAELTGGVVGVVVSSTLIIR